MSDSTIRISQSGLKKIAQDCQDTSSTMNQKFQHLKDEVASLGNWYGDNKDSYGKLQTQWDQAAAAMSNCLAQISTLVTQLADVYNKAELQMAQEWGGSAGTS